MRERQRCLIRRHDRPRGHGGCHGRHHRRGRHHCAGRHRGPRRHGDPAGDRRGRARPPTLRPPTSRCASATSRTSPTRRRSSASTPGCSPTRLGSTATLETSTFNSGTEAVEALFSDAIDASFIGPNPAINAYAKSNGEAIRIVAGTTSGGASLVVREGIDAPADLAGVTLAVPSLGNTQDVALRAWLLEQGYATDTDGGGDVHITPQDNADTLAAFQTGALDGAWVPEPWATRLVLEGGGHVLVNEADLWPEGDFVTTHLIVATEYLNEHPDVIKALIVGLADSIDVANGDAAAAQTTVNAGIEKITTKPLGDETIAGAWENLSFTLDPIASSLQKSADDAQAVGLLDPVDLKDPGIYDLTLLNEVLADRGEEPVTGLE